MTLLQTQTYDLIFCDVKMPNMNGIEFFMHIQNQRPELLKRLIFTTGDVMEINVQELHEKTGCRYLQKPLALEELRETIHSYCVYAD